ncbi:MAG: hypothetical protein JNL09_02925 [Anaerolineales bacterium]|nr:hypothetical protein [Anaerolineales bacterium]
MPNIFSFHRPQFALFAAGLVWLARATIGLYSPDYWSPRTPLDYAAVVGTSAALILTALGVWSFYQHHTAPPSRAQMAWRTGVLVTCLSAFTIGVSNFIEDALNVKGLGIVWVIGFLALTAGLLIAGISAFWVQGFSRWVGGLFIVCALGLLLTEANGLFGLGAALLALSVLKGT